MVVFVYGDLLLVVLEVWMCGEIKEVQDERRGKEGPVICKLYKGTLKSLQPIVVGGSLCWRLFHLVFPKERLGSRTMEHYGQGVVMELNGNRALFDIFFLGWMKKGLFEGIEIQREQAVG